MALASDFGEGIFLDGADGIWQLTDENWEEAIDISKNRHYAAKLGQKLRYGLDELTPEQRSFPFHSALAAYFLIQVNVIKIWQSDLYSKKEFLS